MRLALALALVAACGSDVNRHTRAFVSPIGCSQGPFELSWDSDGASAGDGVEIVACTPHRIAGHADIQIGALKLPGRTFGDGADNASCVGGGPSTTTATGSGGARSATGAAPGTSATTAPQLIEQRWTGGEDSWTDKLCEHLGLQAQDVVGETMLMRPDEPGSVRIRVRLWSDAPNDYRRVVFLVRELTSAKTKAQYAREQRDRKPDKGEAYVPTSPDHPPPPAPLAEQQPPAPNARAAWVPGYWTWTGNDWAWSTGFWRDEAIAMPAPRVERPGAPPAPNAIWMGGSWQVRAGGYVWIGGRWR